MKKNTYGLLTDKQAQILKMDLNSRGVTQSEMAEKMHMSQPEFSRLLHRARKNAVKAKETLGYLKEIGFFVEDMPKGVEKEAPLAPSKPSKKHSYIEESEQEMNEQETVFHKKLKLKLKEKGDEGRISFLSDYLDYLIRNKKTPPPDFPTFVREIMGLDNRAGFIHIRIWHEKSELVEFAINRGYEYRVDHYD